MSEFEYQKIVKYKPSTSKKFKKILYGIIFLLLFQYIYFGFWNTPGINPENSVTITVDEGEGMKSIATKLKKANVINSKFLFLTYAKFTNKDTKFRSGVFRIPLPQNIPSVSDFLINTVSSEQKIVIPEGLKIADIDALLTERELINKGEFIKCTQSCEFKNEILKILPAQSTRNLEGLLFPDTYFISATNFKPEELISKMLNNFENRTSTISNLTYEALIMASILEKEVTGTKDQEIVSGILYKRLKNDWALGADATLLYLKDDTNITSLDLSDDNPYNTRLNKGLPPTPIGNPGLASIEAALNPKKSEFWFYLTTLDTGEVIYSKTNEEHNTNKAKYLN